MPDVPTTAQRIQPSSAGNNWVELSLGMVSTAALMAIKRGNLSKIWCNSLTSISFTYVLLFIQTCIIESHIAKGVVEVIKPVPLTNVKMITL